MATTHPVPGATRWYLVGALPDDAPVAHLMTRSGDLRYRRSACGDRESRTWTPVDLTASGTGHITPCPSCAATLSGASAAGEGVEQLTFDLPFG
ncbi:hypothetical protein [Amycolatopsis sp. FDAARGOS 1241]|uniref:hypothetical protein n=1 Tax=Amycolatopsis sp. FDAARGOS 1241 TaxID=2778070 RepID=UPI001950E607|nr:hypothetical protein [Amycolatopsis sp. FDAARGOS 1241]QRP43631.1 hypothetical protein I6J71_30185 [Amycolatopsis sp. FDAARGOS 1241]